MDGKEKYTVHWIVDILYSCMTSLNLPRLDLILLYFAKAIAGADSLNGNLVRSRTRKDVVLEVMLPSSHWEEPAGSAGSSRCSVQTANAIYHVNLSYVTWAYSLVFNVFPLNVCARPGEGSDLSSRLAHTFVNVSKFSLALRQSFFLVDCI